MNIVIVCADGKEPRAGYLRQQDGQKVKFVADPDSASRAESSCNESYVYARPDDISDVGVSWTETLHQYNETPGDNPLGLLPAWELYSEPIYETYEYLARKHGTEHLYILSGAWGLISATFLTPMYNITFSTGKHVKPYQRRKAEDCYGNFCRLPANTVEPVVFFGGLAYVKFFCSLTSDIKAERYIFHKSHDAPSAPGCQPRKFKPKHRGVWYYECARAFIDGNISL